MSFIKQKQHLKVKNFDIKSVENKKKKHSNLLPNNIRCIIVGPSGCGKTNILLSLLTDINGLKFMNIYLYSKSIQQPKYQFLKQCVSKVPKMGYYLFNENSDVIPPNEAKSNSVIIFDDVTCDKQDRMRDYFSMGRHNSIDCFYLSQTYARIPKHLIRDNANFIILYKQDETNLRHVYDDHVTTDMNFEEFKNFCTKCWQYKYDFAVIDKDSSDLGRYRKGLDTFYKRQ